MDLEVARDLDIALGVISKRHSSFTVLEGLHKDAGCIRRQELYKYLAKHISIENRDDRDYMDHLIERLYTDKRIGRSINDDHVQPIPEGKLFLRSGGYEALLNADKEEAERREKERTAALLANEAIVANLEHSRSEAKRSGRYAILSGVGFLLSLSVAVFSALVEPIYSSKDPDVDGNEKVTRTGSIHREDILHESANPNFVQPSTDSLLVSDSLSKPALDSNFLLH